MSRFLPSKLSVPFSRQGAASKQGEPGWRIRSRLKPLAEFLETRDCPSALASASGIDRFVHASLKSQARLEQRAKSATVHSHDTDSARQVASPSIQLKATSNQVGHKQVAAQAKVQKRLVLYVGPRGGKGVNAGRSPSKPLRSINMALSRAKSGARIILLPGTYTENVRVTNMSNITFVGAANNSSIIRPAGGDAFQIKLSTNITINDVWVNSPGSDGRGVAVLRSSVNLNRIKTNGTRGDGVVVAGGQGVVSSVTATASHFDGVQTGTGFELQGMASATIDNCTFNNNGTAPGVDQSSVGMAVFADSRASVTNSHFDGNTNSGLVANENSQVTVSGSTFSGNQKGNGALFFNQAAVTLNNNTFASNGQVVGLVSGLNGVEFYINYAGNATVTGNVFRNNTAMGIFVGSSAGSLQVTNNLFDNNVVGVFLDSVTGTAPIKASIQGNTFTATNPLNTYAGLVASGKGVNATVGGEGTASNTFENYVDLTFILQSSGSGQNLGCPTVNILKNTFVRGGRPVAASNAIKTC